MFSLLFVVVAIVATGAVLVLRGLRLYRTLKAFGRSANDALGAVTTAAANAEAHATALSGETERLTVAADRLQASLARLAVLRAAANEVKGSIGGLRSAVPRK